MTDNRYNGWTNYATWRVNLENFDNMTAKDLTGRRCPPLADLAGALREQVEEVIEYGSRDEGRGSLARDYALAFLSDVNWWEIAKHMVEDCEDEDQDEDESEDA
jgi:hypothetical protein